MNVGALNKRPHRNLTCMQRHFAFSEGSSTERTERTIMEDTLNIAQSADTGVTGAAAVPHAGEDASSQEETPAAGVENDTSEFDALIKGKYKAQFDEKMQAAIKSRLKGAKEIEGRYQTLVPALQLLSQHYGVEDGDAEGLSRAILGQRAQKTALADRLYGQWMQQSEEMKTAYPDFDLRGELQDAQFRAMLRGGASMRTAYEARHLDTLLPAAMAAAARAVEGKIARRIAADRSRPPENGMGSRSTAVAKADVSKFTKSDMDAVARRVANGERVSFG